MKNKKTIHEREIWLVDLDPTKGIEMKKMRPCLIIRKYNNSHLIAIPLTSQKKEGNKFFALPQIQKKMAETLRFLPQVDECP